MNAVQYQLLKILVYNSLTFDGNIVTLVSTSSPFPTATTKSSPFRYPPITCAEGSNTLQDYFISNLLFLPRDLLVSSVVHVFPEIPFSWQFLLSS